MAASDMHKKLLVKGIPPLPNRSDLTKKMQGKSGGPSSRNYSPLHWDEYFDEKNIIETKDGSKFNLYTKGKTGPVLFLLHGGGYSGLTWACFAKHLLNLIDCRIAAVDLRGHGDTVTSDETNLSAEQQSEDVENVIHKFYGDNPPPIFLMGHSMGGAIVVHVGNRKLIPSLIGLAVIDVVEGSAMDALQSMQNVLRNRPTQFKSIENAVEWCIRSGQVRNLESARISMPSQVIKAKADTNLSKNEEFDEEDENLDEDEKQCKTPSNSAVKNDIYVWRINLSKTEPFWNGWFAGLSKKFLEIDVPKLLLLAGVDRLDKDLTVGQMQGKFQMIVLPKVGHAIHEDSPERVGETIASFFIRNKFAVAKTDFNPVYPGC